MNNLIRSIRELEQVELTKHQQLRILSSSKPFCVIVYSENGYGFIHLVSDARKLIREKYKDFPSYNIFIYDLNN